MVVIRPNFLFFEHFRQHGRKPICRTLHAVKDRTAVKACDLAPEKDVVSASEDHAVGETSGRWSERVSGVPRVRQRSISPARSGRAANVKRQAGARKISERSLSLAMVCGVASTSTSRQDAAAGRSAGSMPTTGKENSERISSTQTAVAVLQARTAASTRIDANTRIACRVKRTISSLGLAP